MTEKQVVVFELSGVSYGIDILQVVEIIRLIEITPVTAGDSFIEGIINLRGRVIPVINLARKLALPDKKKDNETKIIVVEFNDSRIGLIVNRVLEVGKYTGNDMESAAFTGPETGFIDGVVKKESRLWLLLNLSWIAKMENKIFKEVNSNVIEH
ncbi:CheA protein [Desulfocucumis palustris]|uniref:CheA protein n=1 Tax=Desulfocucumis palustris TaxID=1898651 RepID=A0A2L2XCM7_9FIRM|nr:chemotaxis protein CheW [Desulfocucumis palustris]GBF33998.1 CheA protein [Desulfocucumis palustris]